jgi:hypothetical protein
MSQNRFHFHTIPLQVIVSRDGRCEKYANRFFVVKQQDVRFPCRDIAAGFGGLKAISAVFAIP